MNTSQSALWAFLGFAATGAVLACDFESITADELIARDTEAMGGRAAIEAVEAVEVSLHVNNSGIQSGWNLPRPRGRAGCGSGRARVASKTFDIYRTR